MITPKQKQILKFIEEFSQREGYSPSQREIAKRFGFNSLGTVQNYLVRLQKIGAINRSWNDKRGIQVINGSNQIPLVGRVAAGRPIEAVESNELIEIPLGMLKHSDFGKYFVLQVFGDSMIEDGILNGDYVLIRKQVGAANGQTVVALINNEATIKRFFETDKVIELRPANSKYSPIVIDKNENVDFRIEGVLSGVIRYLQ